MNDLPLSGLRVFVMASSMRDGVPSDMPLDFVSRRSYKRFSCTTIRCDAVFSGRDAADRVLPEHVGARHDGRHPDVHCRFMRGSLRGWPFFAWLPWRQMLEKLQSIIDDRHVSPHEWVLCIQCVCAAGRHRSVASAVCIARVLEQFGVCAVLIMYNGRDNKGRTRLCSDEGCACNAHVLIDDGELQEAAGEYLNGVARDRPMLPHIEVETDHWPCRVRPDTRIAQSFRV